MVKKENEKFLLSRARWDWASRCPRFNCNLISNFIYYFNNINIFSELSSATYFLFI